jgi:cardiolipin synthase
MFVDALADCVRRGVDVRVIIDGVGELYGLPRRVGKLLASCGIRVARFLPPRLLPPALYINLRNHRKMLIVDGRVGYTGGMNISDRHLVEQPEPPSRASDMHFRISGPVVTQLEHAFLEDWYFCTGDEQMPQTPFDWSKQPAAELGSAMCRAISEGPNEDFNKLGTILIGAISSARQRVIIVTPYFLPSREMIGTLQSAALRGARVTVLLPEKSNLPYMHWATRNMLWEMLQFGVHTYYQPTPFAHTKLFIVDDFYAHIGSANIDARSLRLNFELNVEIFDREVVRQLAGYVETTKARSRIITSDELEGRSLPVRTRDALVWLFSPYL